MMTTSLENADLLSLTDSDYLTEDQVIVLENGTTLPEPAVLGNKCAAYRVWADVLQPIQSESQQKTLRYVGRYQEGVASNGNIIHDKSGGNYRKYDQVNAYTIEELFNIIAD